MANIYNEVKKYLSEVPNANVTNVMDEFSISQSWAYELISRYKSEKQYLEDPQRALMMAYKQGRDDGYDQGYVQGLITGGLSVSVMEAAGISPLELLEHLKEYLRTQYGSIQAG